MISNLIVINYMCILITLFLHVITPFIISNFYWDFQHLLFPHLLFLLEFPHYYYNLHFILFSTAPTITALKCNLPLDSLGFF